RTINAFLFTRAIAPPPPFCNGKMNSADTTHASNAAVYHGSISSFPKHPHDAAPESALERLTAANVANVTSAANHAMRCAMPLSNQTPSVHSPAISKLADKLAS